MKIAAGRCYLAYCKEHEGLQFVFQILTSFTDKNRRLHVGLKVGADAGSSQTSIFDDDGVEVDPMGGMLPFRLFDYSRSKPRFKVA